MSDQSPYDFDETIGGTFAMDADMEDRVGDADPDVPDARSGLHMKGRRDV